MANSVVGSATTAAVAEVENPANPSEPASVGTKSSGNKTQHGSIARRHQYSLVSLAKFGKMMQPGSKRKRATPFGAALVR
ncbi:MAG: hypothetical protein R3E68_00075 [Burkholderiaceae bacterium]